MRGDDDCGTNRRHATRAGGSEGADEPAARRGTGTPLLSAAPAGVCPATCAGFFDPLETVVPGSAGLAGDDKRSACGEAPTRGRSAQSCSSSFCALRRTFCPFVTVCTSAVAPPPPLLAPVLSLASVNGVSTNLRLAGSLTSPMSTASAPVDHEDPSAALSVLAVRPPSGRASGGSSLSLVSSAESRRLRDQLAFWLSGLRAAIRD